MLTESRDQITSRRRPPIRCGALTFRSMGVSVGLGAIVDRRAGELPEDARDAALLMADVRPGSADLLSEAEGMITWPLQRRLQSGVVSVV